MITFATYAARESELHNVCLLARSLRTFGGRHAEAPVHAYVPTSLAQGDASNQAELAELGVDLHSVADVDDQAAWYYYAQKVFAAAQAESDLSGSAHILAWLDEDTAILQEPSEFVLPEGVDLGYRPVMHRNIGLLIDDPIDTFWRRAFDALSVAEASLFPMVTPTDNDTIRPYFNAGCLIVRPERGLLRKWADHWPVLYRDPEFRPMCEADVKKRIFLHQVALTCAILNHLQPDGRLELSESINYPLFFQEMFGAAKPFDDLTDVTTFRHESYFRDPAPDWDKRIKAPPDRIAWIRKHIAESTT